jgi:hypothetical protein
MKRRKLNWIGHTVRKGNGAIEREALDWNRQAKGEGVLLDIGRRGTARYRGEGVLLDIGENG